MLIDVYFKGRHRYYRGHGPEWSVLQLSQRGREARRVPDQGGRVQWDRSLVHLRELNPAVLDPYKCKLIVKRDATVLNSVVNRMAVLDDAGSGVAEALG